MATGSGNGKGQAGPFGGLLGTDPSTDGPAGGADAGAGGMPADGNQKRPLCPPPQPCPPTRMPKGVSRQVWSSPALSWASSSGSSRTSLSNFLGSPLQTQAHDYEELCVGGGQTDVDGTAGPASPPVAGQAPQTSGLVEETPTSKPTGPTTASDMASQTAEASAASLGGAGSAAPAPQASGKAEQKHETELQDLSSSNLGGGLQETPPALPKAGGPKEPTLQQRPQQQKPLSQHQQQHHQRQQQQQMAYQQWQQQQYQQQQYQQQQQNRQRQQDREEEPEPPEERPRVKILSDITDYCCFRDGRRPRRSSSSSHQGTSRGSYTPIAEDRPQVFQHDNESVMRLRGLLLRHAIQPTEALLGDLLRWQATTSSSQQERSERG